jgi:hypothetical protein
MQRFLEQPARFLEAEYREQEQHHGTVEHHEARARALPRSGNRLPIRNFSWI